jgi:acetyl-CoA carboxylase biotin carboxyl carrier protein
MAASKDSAETADSSADALDTRLVRKLASILRDTGLTEIEVEKGDLKIRVVRSAAPTPAPAPVAFAAPAPPAPVLIPAAPSAPPEPTGDLVRSPMVGTIYHQAQPGTPAFVRVGDRVVEGQTLMIVEAMKTMNPVPAPRAGVVAEILVEDAQPVEYGAPLLVLE